MTRNTMPFKIATKDGLFVSRSLGRARLCLLLLLTQNKADPEIPRAR